MRLSPNFTLEEFLVSQTAERNGIDMTPSQHIIDNLGQLCELILQPLRDDAGVPIFISSGYRPYLLNQLIGGSVTSAHPDGRAADFRVSGQSPIETCRRIVELELPYDQVIHEFGRWVHVGIATEPRREQLTAYYRQGQTRYRVGFHPIEELAA